MIYKIPMRPKMLTAGIHTPSIQKLITTMTPGEPDSLEINLLYLKQMKELTQN